VEEAAMIGDKDSLICPIGSVDKFEWFDLFEDTESASLSNAVLRISIEAAATTPTTHQLEGPSTLTSITWSPPLDNLSH
jgi:hypothetical protein